jgi:hypothetical protein
MAQLSMNQMLAKVDKVLVEAKDEFLAGMAEQLVYGSEGSGVGSGPAIPVDTGAYAESMAAVASAGAGRRISSVGLPRGQDEISYRKAAYFTLLNDLAGLVNSDTVVFTNYSPHAQIVEYGSTKVSSYNIFGNARRMAPYIMQEAIANVKARNGG